LGPATKFGTIKNYRESASICPLCKVLLVDFVAQSAEIKQRPIAGGDVVEMVYVAFLGIWEVVAIPPATTFMAPATPFR